LYCKIKEIYENVCDIENGINKLLNQMSNTAEDIVQGITPVLLVFYLE
jgi:hypothetical protein